MQRTVLIALAAAVVAAGIATTATVLLTDDNEESAALASPSPSASPAATATVETATPAPGASASSAATDAAGAPASPEATDAATTRPGVKLRSAESVKCTTEPQFCSSTDEMFVSADRELQDLSESPDPKSSSRPTVAQDSVVWDKDKRQIGDGGTVGSLHVDVVVTNATDETFVFAKREIVLEIYKDGKLYDTFSTTGSGFEMTPGSKMTGTFDRPITESGNYEWRSKVWYYEK